MNAFNDQAKPGGEEDVRQEFLTFTLVPEEYAIGILAVQEIRSYERPTTIANRPPFIKGVINLRGAVVPVIDLQARFGRAQTMVGKKTCIVIFDASCDGEKLELGLMVDAVSEVIDIPQTLIEAPPQFGTTIQRDFIRGLGKVDGEFIVILEPERALNIDDMALIAEQA